jgi:DnaJ-class molecular chaperone
VSDEDRLRLRRLEALVNKLLERMDAAPIEQACTKCDGKGTWQDGGDCATCDGAGVTFVFTRRLK